MTAHKVFAVICGMLALVPAAHAQVRDSAGVRIVMYPDPAPPGEGLRLAPRPRIVITDSPDCEFNRIRGLIIQSTGSVVVANGGNLELCFFDARGAPIARVGRKGSGPGEYQFIRSLLLLSDDSLAVADPGLRRLTVLSPSGPYVRSNPIGAPSDTLGSLTLALPLRDGTVLLGFSEFRTGAPRPDAVLFTQRVFRYRTDGTLLGRLGRLPVAEHFIQATVPERGGVAYWNLAFGRILSGGATSGGFVAGDGSMSGIGEFGTQGTLRVIHRYPAPVRPVAEADIAGYRERSLAGTSGLDRALTERMVAEMPYPETYPAYARVLTDPLDRIWLEDYPRPGEPSTEWTVLDTRSRASWTVRVPARFSLLALSATMACGVARDADDLESVHCYELTR